jgi:hypothetical protein
MTSIVAKLALQIHPPSKANGGHHAAVNIHDQPAVSNAAASESGSTGLTNIQSVRPLHSDRPPAAGCGPYTPQLANVCHNARRMRRPDRMYQDRVTKIKWRTGSAVGCNHLLFRNKDQRRHCQKRKLKVLLETGHVG